MSIIDDAESENKSQQKKEFDLAKEALKSADTQELFDLYEKAVKGRGDLLVALNIMAEHYAGKSNVPRYHPPGEDIIQSMERVALAAIELAKEVALAVKE